MSLKTPAIGSIVYFNSIKRSRWQRMMPGVLVGEGKLAAIITRDWGNGTVNVSVFDIDGKVYGFNEIPFWNSDPQSKPDDSVTYAYEY